jgi:hypothetical protein
MELHDITGLDQLEAYYRQEGLATVDQKIERLKSGMGIRAVRREFGSADADMLIGLEDYLVNGIWKAYARK